MTAFWIIAGLLVAGALLFVLPPLLSARPRPAAESATNIEVLRDQLRELEADRAAGSIDDAQYAHAREDLERRVLEEGAGTAPPPSAARPGRL
ncbi:MAG: c-type cytochrome biogenesis protein CcmI, partial [Pseudomonadota bacterium]